MDDALFLNNLLNASMFKWMQRHGGIMHILKYDSFLKYGIFGHFQFAGDTVPFCETLSHAYYIDATYQPIVKPGQTLQCQRGIHHIHGADGLEQIETFEIIGIDGHSGLLFHPLNYQIQSEGCTGLGASRARYDSNQDGKIDALDDEMITSSRATFAAWMKRLEGVDSFTLQVL